MTKTFCLLLFLCSFSALRAQTPYSRARVYTNSAFFDAQIRNTAQESTPQSITYREGDNGPEKQMGVADIKRIVYSDGTTYERYPIDVFVISAPYLERTQSHYQIGGNTFRGNALVQKLVSGTVGLYQFVDKYGFAHFFYKSPEDSSIVLIPYKAYVDGGELKDAKAFRNLLAYVAQKQGCGSGLQKEVEAASYGMRSLVSVVRSINACDGGSSEVNGDATAKSDIRFGILAGASVTNLDFSVGNPSKYPGLSADAFPGSTQPTFGVYLTLYPSKRVQNYSVSLEVLYQRFRSTTDSIQANSYTRGQGTVEFNAINISPSLRFLFTQGKARPFLEGGVSVQSILSQKSEYGFVAHSSRYSYSIFNWKGIDLAALAGAGVDFGRFSLHGRYALPLSKANGSYSTIFALLRVNINRGRTVEE